jgi:hypothetical protein
MSLRKKIKLKIQSIIDRLSGEHSQAAPDQRTPYERGTPDENVEVVMARIDRPGAAKTSAKKTKESKAEEQKDHKGKE